MTDLESSSVSVPKHTWHGRDQRRAMTGHGTGTMHNDSLSTASSSNYTPTSNSAPSANTSVSSIVLSPKDQVDPHLPTLGHTSLQETGKTGSTSSEATATATSGAALTRRPSAWKKIFTRRSSTSVPAKNSNNLKVADVERPVGAEILGQAVLVEEPEQTLSGYKVAFAGADSKHAKAIVELLEGATLGLSSLPQWNANATVPTSHAHHLDSIASSPNSSASTYLSEVQNQWAKQHSFQAMLELLQERELTMEKSGNKTSLGTSLVHSIDSEDELLHMAELLGGLDAVIIDSRGGITATPLPPSHSHTNPMASSSYAPPRPVNLRANIRSASTIVDPLVPALSVPKHKNLWREDKKVKTRRSPRSTNPRSPVEEDYEDRDDGECKCGRVALVSTVSPSSTLSSETSSQHTSSDEGDGSTPTKDKKSKKKSLNRSTSDSNGNADDPAAARNLTSALTKVLSPTSSKTSTLNNSRKPSNVGPSAVSTTACQIVKPICGSKKSPPMSREPSTASTIAVPAPEVPFGRIVLIAEPSHHLNAIIGYFESLKALSSNDIMLKLMEGISPDPSHLYYASNGHAHPNHARSGSPPRGPGHAYGHARKGSGDSRPHHSTAVQPFKPPSNPNHRPTPAPRPRPSQSSNSSSSFDSRITTTSITRLHARRLKPIILDPELVDEFLKPALLGKLDGLDGVWFGHGRIEELRHALAGTV